MRVTSRLWRRIRFANKYNGLLAVIIAVAGIGVSTLGLIVAWGAYRIQERSARPNTVLDEQRVVSWGPEPAIWGRFFNSGTPTVVKSVILEAENFYGGVWRFRTSVDEAPFPTNGSLPVTLRFDPKVWEQSIAKQIGRPFSLESIMRAEWVVRLVDGSERRFDCDPASELVEEFRKRKGEQSP